MHQSSKHVRGCTLKLVGLTELALLSGRAVTHERNERLKVKRRRQDDVEGLKQSHAHASIYICIQGRQKP